ELPSVPLGRLYGAELRDWLDRHQVLLRSECPVRRIRLAENRVERLELRDGGAVEADWYVSAVPHDRLLDLLPEERLAAVPYVGDLRKLETSPITSVHLWYDRPVSDLPHVVLVGCVGQWVFNRGETAPGEYYLQVVVSAARQFRGLGHDEVQRRIVAE